MDPKDLFVFAIRYFNDDNDVAEMAALISRAAKSGYNGLALVTGRDYTGNWWDSSNPCDSDAAFRTMFAGAESWWIMAPERRKRILEVKRLCDESGIELIPLLWSVGYNSMRYACSDFSTGERYVPFESDGPVFHLPLDGEYAGDDETVTRFVDFPVEPFSFYTITGLVGTHSLYWAEHGAFGCGARCAVWTADGKTEIASVAPKGPATRDAVPFELSFASGANTCVKIEIGKWWDATGSCVFKDVAIKRTPCRDLVIHSGEACARTWFASRQSGACMGDPRLKEYFRKSAYAMMEALAPRKWFLSMDEIRLDCNCPYCRNTPFATRLANCFKAEYEAIKEVCPEADVYTWSDMLDIGHNAPSESVLDLLPRDIVIACWYGERANESSKLFIESGRKVLGAGYYDAPDENGARQSARIWSKALHDNASSAGFMYTTWKGNKGCTEGDYRFLESFSDELQKERRDSRRTNLSD